MKPLSKIFTKDKLRMAQWLIFAIVFYAIAAVIALNPNWLDVRAVGAVFQRLGHITIAAFVGYWIDRNAFKFVQNDTLGSIRRAIIIGASILAISLGG